MWVQSLPCTATVRRDGSMHAAIARLLRQPIRLLLLVTVLTLRFLLAVYLWRWHSRRSPRASALQTHTSQPKAQRVVCQRCTAMSATAEFCRYMLTGACIWRFNKTHIGGATLRQFFWWSKSAANNRHSTSDQWPISYNIRIEDKQKSLCDVCTIQ